MLELSCSDDPWPRSCQYKHRHRQLRPLSISLLSHKLSSFFLQLELLPPVANEVSPVSPIHSPCFHQTQRAYAVPLCFIVPRLLPIAADCLQSPLSHCDRLRALPHRGQPVHSHPSYTRFCLESRSSSSCPSHITAAVVDSPARQSRHVTAPTTARALRPASKTHRPNTDDQEIRPAVTKQAASTPPIPRRASE